MSLLEGIVALVIVALSAIGALGLFQETSGSASRAQAWSAATSYAEAGIETAKTSRALGDVPETKLADGYSRRVRVSPSTNGLVDVVVTVGLPSGASLAVHRLMPAR